jgi:hypothetical protein
VHEHESFPPLATILCVALLFGAIAAPAAAAEIDACKYVAVTEQARDQYGIAAEVRKQAAERGFIVVTETRAVPVADAFKACVITADWLGSDVSGEVVLQVMDAVTGTPVAVSRVGGLNWSSTDRAMRLRLAQNFDNLGYTGFKEDVYRARMERLYPPRPKMALAELDVIQRTQGVEGVWVDPDGQYRLGIVPVTEAGGADYAAVVLQAAAPLWEPGEIKAELKRTDDPNRFLVTYYLLNKQPVTLNFALSDGDRLSSTLTITGTSLEIVLLRAQ